jgi:Family of unknown function (DUF5677)
LDKVAPRQQSNSVISFGESFLPCGLDLRRSSMNDRLDRGLERKLFASLVDYERQLRLQVAKAWEETSLYDPAQPQVAEVLFGLLARQANLAISIVRSPGTWTDSTAPILLRTMIDCYLTVAWIAKAPRERARAYVLYGIGQAQLVYLQRKEELETAGSDVQGDSVLRHMERWISSERWPEMIEINTGNWAEQDLRKMAAEVGKTDLYRLAFLPFSACVHNNWWHVARANLVRSDDAAHRYVRVPAIGDFSISPTYPLTAAKYFSMTLGRVQSGGRWDGKRCRSFSLMSRAISQFAKGQTPSVQRRAAQVPKSCSAKRKKVPRRKQP